MGRSILIIGEKYRRVFDMLRKRMDPARANIMHLYEADYDMRLVPFYLSFDLVVSPYRLCLLHLALNRQRSKHRPFLLLATDATENLRHLVSGHICDEIWKSFEFDMEMRRLPREESLSFPGPPLDRRVSAAAFVEFMAYLGRDRHGANKPWGSLPVAEAYPQALAYYQGKSMKDMTNRNLMLIRPAFPVPELQPSSELRTCFMIMPFTERLSKLYHDIIKPTIEAIGITISRGDDFFTTGSVMQDVWRRVCLADFLVADLTGKNTNVYYELGIAHTLGKPVILLSQSMEDIPFDVRDKRVILYGTEYDDIEPLKLALRSSIDAIREEHATQFPEAMFDLPQ